MKFDYKITTELDQEQIFEIMREYVANKTGKQLANICWEDSDAGISCELVFCNEPVELS